VSLNGSVATVQTDVGTLEMTLDGIGATITATGADAVTIKTAVGDIQGKITSVDGRTADIQTNLGLISASTDSIKAQTGLQPTSIALSLVGALAAIIAAVLIFRKLYKKGKRSRKSASILPSFLILTNCLFLNRLAIAEESANAKYAEVESRPILNAKIARSLRQPKVCGFLHRNRDGNGFLLGHPLCPVPKLERHPSAPV
jgi:hypothetical protein